MHRRSAVRFIRNSVLLGLALALTSCGGEQAPEGEAPETVAPPSAATPTSVSAPGAVVFIISPADGATVASPVAVKFGVSGMAIAPAGQQTPNSGHHHLVIDAELPAAGQPIPASAQYMHYGKGQTETTVELAPGQHTLQLVLGDANHIPHEPQVVSKVVTITVE